MTFEDWKRTYAEVKGLPLFSWVPAIVEGLKEDNMNLEVENEGRSYERRLTVQHNERMRMQVSVAGSSEDAGGEESKRNAKLTTIEVDNIREFFNNEIKNKPAQEVHALFRKMFKDMKNNKLRKYIFQSISQVIGLTFVFLVEIVLNICKETTNEQRLTFLFNIFSKQQKVMRGKAIKDFIEVFRLPMQVFKLATFLSQEQYLDELDGVDIDFSALTAAKPMIIAMTAVTPETDEEEREAIMTAMNGNKSLETFIYETLPEEQEYYVIEKNFWE